MPAEPAPARPGVRFALAAALCLVLGLLGGLLAAAATRTEARPARFSPPVEEPATFRLRDHEGRWTSPETARGQVLVLTFLYSSCREVCPRQAQIIGEAVGRAGGEDIQVYGVSVDPVIDDPVTARAFLRRVGLDVPIVRYLLGSREELAPVWGAYGIVPISPTPEEAEAAREGARGLEAPGPPLEPIPEKHGEPPPAALEPHPDVTDLEYRGRSRHGSLAFEHSAYVMLIDRQGRQRVGIPHEQLDPASLARDLRRLVAEG